MIDLDSGNFVAGVIVAIATVVSVWWLFHKDKRDNQEILKKQIIELEKHLPMIVEVKSQLGTIGKSFEEVSRLVIQHEVHITNLLKDVDKLKNKENVI